MKGGLKLRLLKHGCVSSNQEEQRQKKIANAEHRILTTEVNNEAKRLKTCCIHSKPTSDTSVFGTCTVHMEPNEWWRVKSRIEVLSRQITLNHFDCKKLFKPVKKNSKASGSSKIVSETFVPVPVPDITSCSDSASLSHFFAALKKNWSE